MKKINKKLIKNRFYTSHYFKITSKILKTCNDNHVSTLQFKTFYPFEYMACGAEECIEILKTGLTKKQFNSLIIYYLPDGSICKPNMPILSIVGKYSILCEFENILDSILARRSSVSTNCYNILKYLRPDQIIFMSDRSDDYHLQPYDGYAAWVAGIYKFSNESHLVFINDPKCQVYGSMPHGLIHQYKNDIKNLLNDYLCFESTNSCLLVDFENNILKTLSESKFFFNRLTGIRIDTSKTIIDKCVENSKVPGVTHELVKKVRKYLNNNNGSHIKIVASSDNNLKKIKYFIKNKTPIDYYGIGSYLTALTLHFTADLVTLDDKKYSKVGRKYLPIKNLQLYKK